MPVSVDVTSDGVRATLGRARVREIVRATLRASRVKDALVSVTFVTRRRITALNRAHLGHSGATDVISFHFAPSPGGPLIGDIYVAPDVARENARALGCGVREEVTRLVVHGTLHVMGHDHPEGAGRTTSPMWRTQERIVARLTRSAA